STTARRSVGRGASSSCARTAIRRACFFVSRRTDGRLGERGEANGPEPSTTPRSGALRLAGRRRGRRRACSSEARLDLRQLLVGALADRALEPLTGGEEPP